jgi:acetolactate synthase-1/2/3 large subunit
MKPRPSADPQHAALESAARLLRRAKRPVCLAGRGAVWSDATRALLALCEGVPLLSVASTPGAKGVFPENHERARGVFGFGGHAMATKAVTEADALLVVGSRLFEQSSADFHPRLQGPGMIRVDRDAKYERPLTSELFLQGDARDVLERLARRLGPTLALGSAEATARASVIPVHDGPVVRGHLIKPQALLGSISRLAANVPITADAGMSMCWAIEWLERLRPRDFQVSLDWGSMGFALPAAIGISLSRKAPAIALTGDGSMAMFGGDLHTAVELGLPLVVIVLNDSGGGMVRAGCDAWFGANSIPDPDYRHRMNFSHYARALGADSHVVTDLAAFEQALRAALGRATPTLIDVHVDPVEVPAAIRDRVKGLEASSPTPVRREGGGIC